MTHLRTALVAGLALLAPAALALGAPVVVHDSLGRPFTVDAQVPGVDVTPYVDTLSAAVHGDEIHDLTVRIVPAASIRARCNDTQAVACYEHTGTGDGIITVPPTLTRQERASLLHEYGHHIDATYGNGARADPNGTPRWWRARGMGRLVRRGLAVPSYAHGWSHSIGEIFAEDYMAMNGGGRSGIGWLRQPSAAVRAALRADIAPYPGPRPEWPAGASAWRGFTAGPVGQGQLVTMQVPVTAARAQVSAVVRPDPARGVVALTLTVTCRGAGPLVHVGARGEGMRMQVVPVAPTTCIAEVRADGAAPGGASLQVVVGPA